MPTIDGDRALVILPTYNERGNIGRILPAILSELPRAHVLVVDDLSPDGTADIAEALGRTDPRIHVLRREGPRGLGRAYLHGFQWALQHPEYAFVFEMDADFSHQPRYLPHFLRAAAQADLVLGCRYMPGGGVRGWAPHRQMLSRGGNRYARMMLDLPYRDLTGGFKCFRREVLARMDLDAVRSAGYCFQIELTWRAHRHQFRIEEIPIVFPDRQVGQSKMSLAIFREAVAGVWRLRGL